MKDLQFNTKLSSMDQLDFLKFAIDNMSDAIFLIGPESEFLFVNMAACRHLGYTRDELMSLSVPDVDTWYKNADWPMHFEDLEDAGTLVFETRHIKKDGTIMPVEIRANLVELSGMKLNCAFARNITGRLANMEALNEAEARLSSIFQLCRDMIFIIDDSGIIHNVNPRACEVLDCEDSDLVGNNFSQYLTRESADHFSEMFGSILEESDHAECSLDLVSRDGNTVTATCRSDVLTDEEGEITSVILYQSLSEDKIA